MIWDCEVIGGDDELTFAVEWVCCRPFWIK